MNDSNYNDVIRRQYATDELIKIRQQIHEKYTYPRHDYAEWVLSNYQWKGGERVLDVGCGNGTYYYPLQYCAPDNSAPISYFGIDLSEGILKTHPAAGQGRLLTADVIHLPFADHTFDVVMANHMLYYVKELDHVMVEIKRVLKRGGTLIASTNSLFDMYTLRKLLHRSVTLLSRQGATLEPMSAPSDPFTLELGVMMLSRYFYGVMRSDLPSALVFDDIEPFMIFLESTRELREHELPSDVSWNELMAFVRQQVLNRMGYDGSLVIDKLSGVLIGTDSDDFISEFVKMRKALQTARGKSHDTAELR